MTAPTTPVDPLPGAAIEPELATLEQRLGVLLAHTRALRAANETLRRDVAAAEARNQALSERVSEAKRRLDALLARLPEPAE
jgi:chromosome segregation ATPase